MLPTAIASNVEAPPRWSHHPRVLATLALLTAALSLVLWFHPTLGYARGGILDGADLRSDMIQLAWWSLLAFGAASTAMIAVMPTRVGSALRYVLAYGTGAGAVVLALSLLDRIY